MSIDSIGNFLTIIRNGIMASKISVVAPHSNMIEGVARILKQEGFIKDFQVDGENSIKKIKVALKYVQGESAIHAITRVSTPGCRVYSKVKNIKPVVGGFGISILSTSQGLMTDKQAKSTGVKIGGEIVCKVW